MPTQLLQPCSVTTAHALPTPWHWHQAWHWLQRTTRPSTLGAQHCLRTGMLMSLTTMQLHASHLVQSCHHQTSRTSSIQYFTALSLSTWPVLKHPPLSHSGTPAHALFLSITCNGAGTSLHTTACHHYLYHDGAKTVLAMLLCKHTICLLFCPLTYCFHSQDHFKLSHHILHHQCYNSLS